MTDPELGELEERLRRALHREAARIQPSGDGLRLIRERAQQQRRRRLWLRPTVAAAAATVVVAAALAVPSVLRMAESDPPGTLDAAGARSSSEVAPQTEPPLSPPPSASEPPPAEPPSTTRTTGQATPTEGPELKNLATVWPYASRAEGNLRADSDVANRVHPTLRDPQMTAVEFVQSFVGRQTKLVAGKGVPLERGIGVTVFRQEEVRKAVSLVYLVRVRVDDDSPYVVVEARDPHSAAEQVWNLEPGDLDGTKQFLVAGSLGATADPIAGGATGAAVPASIKVELREPGGVEPIAAAQPEGITDPDRPGLVHWSATLTPVRTLATDTGTIAAWAVDADNQLISFIAKVAR